ncbi:MAG TPA: MlaD family protein [Solirubrobacteraceae bacterium]|nr:MlaD family protein [Solirubrobacteraceae bacterium]
MSRGRKRLGEGGKAASIRAGAILIAIVLVGTYFGFTKSVPLRGHWEMKAAFTTAKDLRPNSPVRIAGVKIGKVTEIQHIRGGRGAVVTMRIDDRSIPIREDAEMKIRPRIFLEGNYFVDVRPGSPSARVVKEGATIPVQQTASPVQFGELLTALQSDTRRDLQIVLDEYGRGLSGRGGRGYNRSIQYWEPAYRDSAIVNEATLGILEHDLSGYIEGAGAVAEAFDRDPDALKSLITDFATTANALAVESANLSALINELPRTLRTGYRALGSLNAAFPAFRRFIAAMRPAARSARPALDAALPFVTQLRLLMGRTELRGLASELRQTVPDLVRLNRGAVPLQHQIRALSSCQNHVAIPWSSDTVPDAAFPAKGPVYQEAPKTLVGLSSESRSFDGNGQYVRSLGSTANFSFAAGDGRRFLTTQPIQGVQPPKAVNGRPPLMPNVPCETQERPDLRTRVQAPPEQRAVDHSRFKPGTPLFEKGRADLLRMLSEQAELRGTPLRVQGVGETVTLDPAKVAERTGR